MRITSGPTCGADVADDYERGGLALYAAAESARRLMEAVARDKAGHSAFLRLPDELREVAAKGVKRQRSRYWEDLVLAGR